MLPTFVIGLREGVEAALIVGIIAAFLGRIGRRDALRWVWSGVGLAVALCLAFAIGLYLIQASLPEQQQETVSAVVSAVAVVVITYMIVWMRRNSRGLKQSLETSASEALARNSVLALVGMAFFAVLREGFETAIFTVAVFSSATNRSASIVGVVLGLAASVALGFGLYRGGVRINLSRFFRFTGLVLVFVAAGLVAAGLRAGHEAGWFNALQVQALDLSWLVTPDTVRGALLTGMLGIPADPTVGEVAGWLVYAILVGVYVARPHGGAAAPPAAPRRPRSRGHRRWAAAPSRPSSSSPADHTAGATSVAYPQAGLNRYSIVQPLTHRRCASILLRLRKAGAPRGGPWSAERQRHVERSARAVSPRF